MNAAGRIGENRRVQTAGRIGGSDAQSKRLKSFKISVNLENVGSFRTGRVATN